MNYMNSTFYRAERKRVPDEAAIYDQKKFKNDRSTQKQSVEKKKPGMDIKPAKLEGGVPVEWER